MTLRPRALSFATVLAIVVAMASTAKATPNFPASLAGDLGLASAPDCSLCHTDGDEGGDGTVNTPFGKNMRVRGLVAYDTASLAMALSLMESEKVDSAGACLPDIEELKAGGNPNVAGDAADCDGGAPTVTSASDGDLPGYGCSLAAADGSGLGPGGIVAFVGLAAWLTRRNVRRVRRKRPVEP